MRRVLTGAIAVCAAVTVLLIGQPAFANTHTPVPNKNHVVGGVIRAKFTSGDILWTGDKRAYASWSLQDTSADGYCAKVWAIATYTTYFLNNTYHPTIERTDTSCSGSVEPGNSGWFPAYQYCSSFPACDAQAFSYAAPDSVTIYVGRVSGDRTLIGTYINVEF